MIKYDSKLEEKYHQELLLREMAGEISNIELQPETLIEYCGQYICKYTPDFYYWDLKDHRNVFVECKGYFRSIDRLRFKLFLAQISNAGGRVLLQSQFHQYQLFDVRLTPRGTLQGHINGKWQRWQFEEKGKSAKRKITSWDKYINKKLK